MILQIDPHHPLILKPINLPNGNNPLIYPYQLNSVGPGINPDSKIIGAVPVITGGSTLYVYGAHVWAAWKSRGTGAWYLPKGAPAPLTDRTCPSCGAKWPLSAKFCATCGEDLLVPAAALAGA